jgi:hypothetical protein
LNCSVAILAAVTPVALVVTLDDVIKGGRYVIVHLIEEVIQKSERGLSRVEEVVVDYCDESSQCR